MACYSTQSFSFVNTPLNTKKDVEKYKTILGYVIPCTAFSVLQSILLQENVSVTTITTTLPCDLTGIYIDDWSKAKQTLKYIKSKINKNGIKPYYHNAYKFTEDQALKIDNFCRYATLYLNLTHYNHPRLGFYNGQSSLKSFSKYPFQHLLTLILFVQMFSRYKLKEYLDIVLTRLAEMLGTKYLLHRELSPIFDILSGQVTGFIVQRRMGKTVAVYGEIARLLTFFPGAKLKILYTVTRAPLANQCYENVLECVKDYITAFNEQQSLLQNTFNTSSWFNSYTYHAKLFNDKKQRKVLIKFNKITNNSIITDAEVNELTCQAFIKLNVSIIIQYFVLHLLKNVICSLFGQLLW